MGFKDSHVEKQVEMGDVNKVKLDVAKAEKRSPSIVKKTSAVISSPKTNSVKSKLQKETFNVPSSDTSS